jgi:Nucleotidyl transferase AbiEii toxin, Type IV TA system
MKTPRKYATAEALRTALETRLQNRRLRDTDDIQRLRRHVAFDRLLARLFDVSSSLRDGCVLKGGYALELRFDDARATRDLDLIVRLEQCKFDRRELPNELRKRLEKSARLQLSDFFTFEIAEPVRALDQAPDGGSRFSIDARLDDRTFAKFQVDVGIGYDVLEPLELVQGEDWLRFAGIPAVAVPALSAEQHWAEKLHAYTRPRVGQNTRVKDLVDLALLIDRRELAADRLLVAIEATFGRKQSHAPPATLPVPPSIWAAKFKALATECGLSYTVTTAHIRVADFWRAFRERTSDPRASRSPQKSSDHT